MAKKTSHIKFFRKVLFHPIMTHIKIPNCDNSSNKSTKDRKEPKRKEFFCVQSSIFRREQKKRRREFNGSDLHFRLFCSGFIVSLLFCFFFLSGEIVLSHMQFGGGGRREMGPSVWEKESWAFKFFFHRRLRRILDKRLEVAIKKPFSVQGCTQKLLKKIFFPSRCGKRRRLSKKINRNGPSVVKSYTKSQCGAAFDLRKKR